MIQKDDEPSIGSKHIILKGTFRAISDVGTDLRFFLGWIYGRTCDLIAFSKPFATVPFPSDLNELHSRQQPKLVLFITSKPISKTRSTRRFALLVR